MKVADLYAGLGIRFDKRSAGRARAELGKFSQSAGKQFKQALGPLQGYMKYVAGGAIVQQVRNTLGWQRSLVRLNISAKGAFGSIGDLSDEILRISNATGVASEQVRDGAGRFVELTGDTETAKSQMATFAKVAQATGADMADVAGAAAGMSQQFGIAGSEMESMFSILNDAGKSGSAELRDIASEVAELGSAYQKFAGSTGKKGATEIAAMLEIVAQGTGGNIAEASTQIRAMFKQVRLSAKELKKEGIDVFDADGNMRDFGGILRQMKAKNFSARQRGELFKNDRAERGFATLLSGREGTDLDEFTAKLAESTSIAQDFNEVMGDDSMRAFNTWNKIKNGLTKAFMQVNKALGFLLKDTGKLVVALTVLVGWFIATKTAAIAAALSVLASWAAALAPLLLAILLVEDVWTAMNGGESVLKKVYDWLVDTFVDAIDFWYEKLTEFWDWFKEKAEEAEYRARNLVSWIPGVDSSADVINRRGKEDAERELARIDAQIAHTNSKTDTWERNAARKFVEAMILQGKGNHLSDSLSAGTLDASLVPSNFGGTAPAVTIVVNGAGDPELVAAEVNKKLSKELKHGAKAKGGN